MPFLSRNVNLKRFWTNDFELRAQRMFLLAFYAWRRGRILIMPAPRPENFTPKTAKISRQNCLTTKQLKDDFIFYGII